MLLAGVLLALPADHGQAQTTKRGGVLRVLPDRQRIHQAAGHAGSRVTVEQIVGSSGLARRKGEHSELRWNDS